MIFVYLGHTVPRVDSISMTYPTYMADSVLMMEAEAAFKHLELPPFIHLHSDSYLRLKLCLMNAFSWHKPGKNLYTGKTSNMPPNNKTTEVRINEFYFKNLKLESPRAFRSKHNVKLE